MKGAFLFQARPDLFPQQRLTDTEAELWSMYYADKNQG